MVKTTFCLGQDNLLFGVEVASGIPDNVLMSNDALHYANCLFFCYHYLHKFFDSWV